MIFAKLDVSMWSHEKFVAAGPAAVGLWCAALAYLRLHESSDGLLKPHVLGMLLGLGEKEARKLADRLVEVGLFGREDAGYVLLRYAEKNETKEQITTRRAETAARVSASRARKSLASHGANGNTVACASQTMLPDASVTESVTALQPTLLHGSVPDSGSDSDLRSQEGEHERAPAIRTPPSESGGWFGAMLVAFAEGVQSVTGVPFSLDAGGPTNSVATAIRTHCKDRMVQAEWAREKGAAWARTRVAEGRTLVPFDFGQWLSSGAPPPKTRAARPGVQPVGPGGFGWKIGGG